MLQTVLSPAAVGELPSRSGDYLRAYRFMLLARVLDEKFASIYRSGKIHGGVFIGRGQEAVSVAAGMALRPGDVFAPGIRDQAGRLAFGESVLDAARTYLGSVLGPMRGRDGNIHRGRPREGLLAMISHLGAMLSVVNGMLFARRLQGKSGSIGLTCVGDGGMSTGAAHEALNQAGVEKLPAVVIAANNQYAYSTPNERQFACASLLDRAQAYGLHGHQADGTDLEDCLKTISAATARARAGEGPQLVVADFLRLCGHGEHDDAHYIDPRLKASPTGRDCLKVAERHILDMGWSEASALRQWSSEAHSQVNEAIAKVQREPSPDPYSENWLALSTLELNEGQRDGSTPP